MSSQAIASMVKKLSASSEGVCDHAAPHELKKIQAAARGDFVALSFLLLKEVVQLRSRHSQVVDYYEKQMELSDKEIEELRAADEKNHALYTETAKNLKEAKEEIVELEGYLEKCWEHNGELADEKEELRQQLGYKTVELEDAKRTIKKLEQTVDGLSVFKKF